MPREGKKTLLNTTVPELLVRLIDAYIEKESSTGFLTDRKKMSRAEVMEDAFLFYAMRKGALEQLLQSLDYPTEKVKNIITRLQREYGTSRKDQNLKE